MDERRQLPRWEIKKEAKVLMQGESANDSDCFIEDMNSKGMCISFKKQLPPQGIIKMSFAIGENFDFIKIEARIPWEKQEKGRYVYGLSFNKIEDTDKDRLYQYVYNNCYDQLKDKWWSG
jgi:c-di-GMP-binding flagellar brake protein YcgR